VRHGDVCAEVFARLFQKAALIQRAERWSPSAEGETPFAAFLFCQAFFFGPLVSKKKAGIKFNFALLHKGNSLRKGEGTLPLAQ